MALPELYGSWLLVRRLAERSMSEVFVAVRAGDVAARWYVLKRPQVGERASGKVAESIRSEAAILKELSAAEPRLRGVVSFVETGLVAGLPYLVVEHVRGASLERLLRGAPLPAEVARLVVRDLAESLAALHERGIVHGDVAPSNVVVDEDGALVLVDFGLAMRAGDKRATPRGTAGYVSPEAALGRAASAADDAYSWGVIAAELTLGRRLFDDGDLAAAAVRTSLPAGARIDGLPEVERALSADPEARPALAEVAAALEVDTGARVRLAELAAEAEVLREAEASGAKQVAESAGALASAKSLARMPPAAAPPRTEASLARAEREAVSVAPSPEPPRPPSAVWSARIGLTLLLAVLGAALFGFVAGRRVSRSRMGQITLPMLPARTEILLDGRVVLVPEPGRAIPIEPGRHTLSLEVARRDAKEYEFVVQPGEHVLVVNVTPRAATRARDAREGANP
jgi:serine/threonine protein kinase